MRRRTALQLAAAGCAGLSLSRLGVADDPGGPLFLHVQAGGGWDPTLLCDPRPEVSQIGFAAGQTAPSAAGDRFDYAHLSGTGAPISKDTGYAFSTFFDTYREQLLVINGLYTESVGHRSGARYAASGRIAAGYPALSALVAAEQGAQLAMPFVVLAGGGYSHTGGHVTPTRIGSGPALAEAARPNIYANGTQTFYPEAEHKLVIEARAARLARLIDADPRPHVRDAMKRLAWARSHADQLDGLLTALDQGPIVTPPPNEAKTRSARHIFNAGFMALVAHEQGLSRAGVMSVGSFDTHADHDALHPAQIQNVLQGLDLLMQEAAQRSIEMVLLITSEFGRTAKYNMAGGKDHWPVTSWMVLQTPGVGIIKPGRVVGKSAYDPVTKQILACDLDLKTLEPGKAAGEAPLTPEMCHVGLRQCLGIDDGQLADHRYPITGPDALAVFKG